MKAEELVRDAMQELGQLAAETPITPDQYSTGIRYANRMFMQHDYLGLGYTILVNANDNVTIPGYAEEWAVKALAVRLASQYSAFDGLDLLKVDERNAYNLMLRSVSIDVRQEYPAGLPVGIANENDICVDPFYPGSDEELILNESGGFIALE